MIPRKRTPLSAVQRVEVLRRRKAGESLHAIGRAVGKDHVVVHLLLQRHSGIAPAAHHRSQRVLTLAEREDISRGIASRESLQAIATCLHRVASTVSREVARHGGRAPYRASEADQQAWQSALRPRPCLLARTHYAGRNVAGKLMQDWSPPQISGWLKMEYPKDENLRVSHETIYRSPFLQARGALKQELVRHLRSKRRIRRSRHSLAFTGPRAGRSSMRFPSANGRPRSKTEPFPVTGKAICCAGSTTAEWPRSSSLIRASACW
jgi:Helix-turn-helix domain